MSRRALGYVRVSTDRQDLSPDAQRRAIAAEAERRGWDVTYAEDTCSGATPLDRRDGGRYALSLLEGDRADVLIVAKLDRLCRSVLDGASIIERAEAGGWSLVALDLGMDTSMPMGRAMAHVALAFAELERERISERTREGLAEARARGTALGGARFRTPADVAARVRLLRDEGLTFQAVADRLDAEGVPTTLGGRRWWPSTVRAILDRERAGL